MNRLYLATVLPAVALALVLPAWASAPSDQAKENGATTVSDQANQASSGSDGSSSPQSDLKGAQEKGNAGEQNAHGPTAIMDRATPKEKSDDGAHGPTAIMDRATPTEKPENGDASAKHPPTVRMDQSTPNQKSPASASTGNDAQAPSAAK